MLQRLPQPPVNRAVRRLERHDWWTGLALALVGSVLLLCGARHLTSVETVEGGTAWETQLVKAFASSGLQFPDQVAPPPPPKGNDPVALERWAKRNEQFSPPTWKVRVDTAASAPCPT